MSASAAVQPQQLGQEVQHTDDEHQGGGEAVLNEAGQYDSDARHEDDIVPHIGHCAPVEVLCAHKATQSALPGWALPAVGSPCGCLLLAAAGWQATSGTEALVP